MKIEKRRDASKRLTVEIYSIEIENYIFLTSKIAEKFNLTPSSELIHGLDETFQDYTDEIHTIGLEWDIWSGYIIVAKDQKSEKLVNDIFNWLSSEGIPQKVSLIERFINILKFK